MHTTADKIEILHLGLFWAEVTNIKTFDGEVNFPLLSKHIMAGLLSIPCSNADYECRFSMLRKLTREQAWTSLQLSHWLAWSSIMMTAVWMLLLTIPNCRNVRKQQWILSKGKTRIQNLPAQQRPQTETLTTILVAVFLHSALLFSCLLFLSIFCPAFA